MNQVQRVITSVVALILGCSSITRAADRPQVDISAEYAFSHLTQSDWNYPAGWFGSVGAYVTPTVALVGEASGAYRSESLSLSNAGFAISVSGHQRICTFMAGPKVSLSGSGSRTRAFARFLAGGATTSYDGSGNVGGTVASVSGSTTKFALSPGGGVDVKMSAHLTARLFANAQFIAGERDWVKVVQTGAGLVWTR